VISNEVARDVVWGGMLGREGGEWADIEGNSDI